MLRFTYQDGSESYIALHRVQTIYRNDRRDLTVRIDRADGYWEEFVVAAFELLEVGRLYG